MPNMGLSSDEAKAVLAYIEAQSGNKQSPLSAPGTIVSVGEANIGRDIFTGKIPLKNGGAACVSCHNISGISGLGGGTVGRDLTMTYSTLGQQGLVSLLKTMPFSIMAELYSTKPLTEEEISYLVAFFAKASSSPETTPAQSPRLFIIIGGPRLAFRGRTVPVSLKGAAFWRSPTPQKRHKANVLLSSAPGLTSGTIIT